MKKGVIIINRYSKIPPMLSQANRLFQEFNALGYYVPIIQNGYNTFIDEGGNVISELKDLDFCVYLDKDKYVGEMLTKLGVKTFNNPLSIETCDDKMKTYIALSGSGVKVCKTFSSPLCYTDSIFDDAEFDGLLKHLSFPLILKLSYSSQGKGVFLIKDKSQLKELSLKYKYQPKVYQEFVSSSYGKDVRIITIGKKFLMAMERSSKGDFRSNGALGGEGRVITPPPQFIAVAEKVASLLNLDYMGIDLLYGASGEPIVCEVNSNAFFDLAEKCSNVNVARAYAEYIINTINEVK